MSVDAVKVPVAMDEEGGSLPPPSGNQEEGEEEDAATLSSTDTLDPEEAARRVLAEAEAEAAAVLAAAELKRKAAAAAEARRLELKYTITKNLNVLSHNEYHKPARDAFVIATQVLEAHQDRLLALEGVARLIGASVHPHASQRTATIANHHDRSTLWFPTHRPNPTQPPPTKPNQPRCGNRSMTW